MSLTLEDCLAGVGAGWSGLVKRCYEAAVAEGISVAQVKEKFGGLRFYTTGGSNALFSVIDSAEAESFRICEECGQPGYPSGGGYGWVRTLCEDHHEARVKENGWR